MSSSLPSHNRKISGLSHIPIILLYLAFHTEFANYFFAVNSSCRILQAEKIKWGPYPKISISTQLKWLKNFILWNVIWILKNVSSEALPIEILVCFYSMPECEGGGSGIGGWSMPNFCEETSRCMWIMKSPSSALQGSTSQHQEKIPKEKEGLEASL